MLKFNDAGLLVPPLIIKSTIEEFENYFAIDSPENTRRVLFDQYIIYKNNIKKLCGNVALRQWIDGSFVTKKLKPLDIDLITFIDFETADIKEAELRELIYPASFTNYGLDCYTVVIYPENHHLHFAYKSDRSYWINQFDKTKPNRMNKNLPKGFLEIII